MDERLELERLAAACADLKKTIDEDLQNRKRQDKSDKRWQLTTLILPIVFTSGVGFTLSNGQARLQESIATSEEFNTHRLAQYEDLDKRAISLQAAIAALTDDSQDGSSQGGVALGAAVNALHQFEVPLTRLYFDDEFDKSVSNIKDLVSHSKYLGGKEDTSEGLVTSVQNLEQLMLKKLASK